MHHRECRILLDIDTDVTAEARPALSPLWGLDGEAYNDAGPLRDWHRAGYAAGERAIPSPAAASDLVTDWGAVGDGIKDDTQVASALSCCRQPRDVCCICQLCFPRCALPAVLRLMRFACCGWPAVVARCALPAALCMLWSACNGCPMCFACCASPAGFACWLCMLSLACCGCLLCFPCCRSAAELHFMCGLQ